MLARNNRLAADRRRLRGGAVGSSVNRAIQCSVFIVLLILPIQSRAFWLWATESTDMLNPIATDEWKILKDFISKDADGKPTLDFHENAVAHNRLLIAALGSLNIESAAVKKQIAEDLLKFSDLCDMSKFGLNIGIAPIPQLSHAQANVQDPRRITALSMVGCLPFVPHKCIYIAADRGDTGLLLPDLMYQLDACRQDISDTQAIEQEYASDPCADMVTLISSDEDRYDALIHSVDDLAKLQGGINCKPGLRKKTPLMAAIDRGNYGLVEALIKDGARPNDIDDNGKTAFDHANDSCTRIKEAAQHPSDMMGGLISDAPSKSEIDNVCDIADIVEQAARASGAAVKQSSNDAAAKATPIKHVRQVGS